MADTIGGTAPHILAKARHRNKRFTTVHFALNELMWAVEMGLEITITDTQGNEFTIANVEIHDNMGR